MSWIGTPPAVPHADPVRSPRVWQWTLLPSLLEKLREQGLWLTRSAAMGCVWNVLPLSMMKLTVCGVAGGGWSGVCVVLGGLAFRSDAACALFSSRGVEEDGGARGVKACRMGL